jgi:hypothetical protein
MDRFVTVNRQKETEEIVGRDTYIKNIQGLLASNTSFCVYGSTGVGKSFLMRHALVGINYIELTSEMLKNDFITRVKTMHVHILADDVDVSEPLSLGSTIVVSDAMVENFECMQVEPLSCDDLVSIGAKKSNLDAETLRLHAMAAKGDVRTFLYRLKDFTNTRDMFKSPKDFVYDIVCVGGCLEPRDYLCKTVTEHGYSWGIVHENYPDAPELDLDGLARVADLMSYADVKDDDIYNGYEHKTIFSLFAVTLPAIEINHTLERSTMRPGSAWTKFNNYKMRYKRYNNLVLKTKIDIDSLMVISQYCKAAPNDVKPMLQYYGIEPPDVDMMNHLSLINKMKPRVLQTIKAKLKSDKK